MEKRSLTYTSEFCAAHRLPRHKGKCQRLHGHNWLVELKIFCYELNEEGFIVDFGIVKKKLKKILDFFDHRLILWKNDPILEDMIKILGGDNVVNIMNQPTCENLAELICKNMARELRDLKIERIGVVVEEAPGQSASFSFKPTLREEK